MNLVVTFSLFADVFDETCLLNNRMPFDSGIFYYYF